MYVYTMVLACGRDGEYMLLRSGGPNLKLGIISDPGSTLTAPGIVSMHELRQPIECMYLYV